ncbi:MAG: hypothetical protein FRX49_11013 [Trebouxia sp. A1-2]|nr:MAG: hypothetical protein FRX49_11013 [Trebouxia sp. A1-2]
MVLVVVSLSSDGSGLRHDPDAAAVVTEVWQLFVSGCSAVDTAFVAYSLWSGGHSLWSLARWTQPLGLSCGAEDTALWSIAQVDFCPEIWSQVGSGVQGSNDTQDVP